MTDDNVSRYLQHIGRIGPCFLHVYPSSAETLANFKVPAYVTIQTEKLPRNASGKLLKNVLRGEGEVSFAETM